MTVPVAGGWTGKKITKKPLKKPSLWGVDIVKERFDLLLLCSPHPPGFGVGHWHCWPVLISSKISPQCVRLSFPSSPLCFTNISDLGPLSFSSNYWCSLKLYTKIWTIFFCPDSLKQCFHLQDPPSTPQQWVPTIVFSTLSSGASDAWKCQDSFSLFPLPLLPLSCPLSKCPKVSPVIRSDIFPMISATEEIWHMKDVGLWETKWLRIRLRGYKIQVCWHQVYSLCILLWSHISSSQKESCWRSPGQRTAQLSLPLDVHATGSQVISGLQSAIPGIKE